MADTLQKFMFEDCAVRGELVELSETWLQVQSLRQYPKAIRSLLGEMMSAAALLSANLKFDGSIVMQIHGDGPVTLLVVECDSALQMRATAKYAPDAAIPDDAGLRTLVNQHGHGRFAITLDPREKLPGQQAYQGIVSLDGDSVATVIENYMLRSEQLDTKLWLAADDKVSRGLLLQKLPGEGGSGKGGDADLDEWNHVVTLASTLRNEEMLQVDIKTLMHRLFWEETVRVFDPQHPSFRCSCSRERVGNMLKMLGREEIDSALADLDSLAIDCDFCGQHYQFDAVDCAQLFATDLMVDAIRQPGDLKQ
ncbi:Hsp33 family molecular chaperone HslO [Lacisediminimonas profundi]|uniref:Hsp33 family molecular chaperone HslO n=1 Tax=Lacisediminimonas profundi TaxID=2603856 RepID=UPI00124B3377|nr:Hsp33 family molecular chaperone HslO [Lacisediminimonas profundi]